MIKYDINGKEILGTTTPILIWCTSERSMTIGKIINKKENGETKEYVLRVTKDGNILLN